MSLKEQITKDRIESMKAKETVRKDLLSVILGEIKNEELRGTITTDESILVILRKMEKSLKLTNTPESLAEVDYLTPYLPTLMSEEKIVEIINGYKANGISNVGQLMGEFNKNFKGQADNSVVSRIVKEALA